jgi:hypothetical protein
MPPGGLGDSEPKVKALVFTMPHWTLFFDGPHASRVPEQGSYS